MSSQRLVTERFSSRFTKLRFACVTSVVRSAKNRMFLTQPQRSSTSQREITVRVLPEPVAITSSALRRLPFPKLSQTALTALI